MSTEMKEETDYQARDLEATQVTPDNNLNEQEVNPNHTGESTTKQGCSKSIYVYPIVAAAVLFVLWEVYIIAVHGSGSHNAIKAGPISDQELHESAVVSWSPRITLQNMLPGKIPYDHLHYSQQATVSDTREQVTFEVELRRSISVRVGQVTYLRIALDQDTQTQIVDSNEGEDVPLDRLLDLVSAYVHVLESDGGHRYFEVWQTVLSRLLKEYGMEQEAIADQDSNGGADDADSLFKGQLGELDWEPETLPYALGELDWEPETLPYAGGSNAARSLAAEVVFYSTSVTNPYGWVAIGAVLIYKWIDSQWYKNPEVQVHASYGATTCCRNDSIGGTCFCSAICPGKASCCNHKGCLMHSTFCALCASASSSNRSREAYCNFCKNPQHMQKLKEIKQNDFCNLNSKTQVSCSKQCIYEKTLSCRKCKWSRWNGKTRSCATGDKCTWWDGAGCNTYHKKCYSETHENGEDCDGTDGIGLKYIGECSDGQCKENEKGKPGSPFPEPEFPEEEMFDDFKEQPGSDDSVIPMSKLNLKNQKTYSAKVQARTSGEQCKQLNYNLLVCYANSVAFRNGSTDLRISRGFYTDCAEDLNAMLKAFGYKSRLSSYSYLFAKYYHKVSKKYKGNHKFYFKC